MRERTTPAKVDITHHGFGGNSAQYAHSLNTEVGDVVEITVKKIALTEKEKSQSINPLMAGETLIPVSA
ncbi:hypothetical protein [Methanothrix soehngenii]|uniref:hypothetical protein n=1 Tax=Methanothrix soehngenii TaxID=2223 RepID=UPI00300CE866